MAKIIDTREVLVGNRVVGRYETAAKAKRRARDLTPRTASAPARTQPLLRQRAMASRRRLTTTALRGIQAASAAEEMERKMPKIDHYMVDYADEALEVQLANDAPIFSLTAAKALAAKTSKIHGTGAYVVAYADYLWEGFKAVGHISFFDGKQSETDGTVI